MGFGARAHGSQGVERVNLQTIVFALSFFYTHPGPNVPAGAFVHCFMHDSAADNRGGRSVLREHPSEPSAAQTFGARLVGASRSSPKMKASDRCVPAHG